MLDLYNPENRTQAGRLTGLLVLVLVTLAVVGCTVYAPDFVVESVEEIKRSVVITVPDYPPALLNGSGASG